MAVQTEQPFKSVLSEWKVCSHKLEFCAPEWKFCAKKIRNSPHTIEGLQSWQFLPAVLKSKIPC